MSKNQIKPTFTTLVAPKSNNISRTDHLIVILSSLFVGTSFVWLPAVYIWLYRKWTKTPDDEGNGKKRRIYRNIIITAALIGIIGPHRNEKFAQIFDCKNWRIVKAWVNYLSYEVISEATHDHNFDMKNDQAILGVAPHGILPFSLGFASLPQIGIDTFGKFRPVAASATRFLPFLRSLMDWAGSIDANRTSIERAIANGDRIGLCPGGIAEMFEGYPKPGRLPDDECVLLKSRKGFVRLALKHKIPLIPVYCFGATKMFKRFQLPVLEKISNFLRISIVLFFGKYGKDGHECEMIICSKFS